MSPFSSGVEALKLIRMPRPTSKGCTQLAMKSEMSGEILRGQPPLGGLPAKVLRRGQKESKIFRRLKKAFLSRIGQSFILKFFKGEPDPRGKRRPWLFNRS